MSAASQPELDPTSQMLSVIRQHGSLTMPELIARVGVNARDLFEGLSTLYKAKLIDIHDPKALHELEVFLATEGDRLEGENLASQRNALFSFALRPGLAVRKAKLTPAQPLPA